MKRYNLLAGALGVMAGVVIGFLFANNINRSAGNAAALALNGASGAAAWQDGLPPGHPPLGTSTGAGNSGTPLPPVSEAIDRARVEPNNYEAQMTAADLYYQIQRFDNAARLYEAAAKLRPDEGEPLMKCGNAYFDAEDYQQAERWYLLALQKQPKNLTVRTDLGLTFFLRDPPDIKRAIREYNASLEIDPKHELSLQNLVMAYRENGETDKERSTLERLRKVNPNNPAIVDR